MANLPNSVTGDSSVEVRQFFDKFFVNQIKEAKKKYPFVPYIHFVIAPLLM